MQMYMDQLWITINRSSVENKLFVAALLRVTQFPFELFAILFCCFMSNLFHNPVDSQGIRHKPLPYEVRKQLSFFFSTLRNSTQTEFA